MALELNTSYISGNEGTTTLFNDITGVTASNSYSKGGNIGYADVDAVRFKIASLESIYNVATLNVGDTFSQYTEYICTAGSGTIDGKVISGGQYFIPQSSGLSVPSGMTFETTGYYNPPILATWLPTASQVPLTLSLAQVNQTSNSTLQDSLYTIQYEVYVDSFTGTQAAVSGQRYMVLTSTATYSGNIYRFGEIFIATDTSSIVASGNVVKLNAAITQYFTITWNMLQSLFTLVVIPNSSLQAEIYEIRVQLEMLANSCATGNVSYTYSRGLIARLQGQTTYLLNNY
jgi:hypothetical protein